MSQSVPFPAVNPDRTKVQLLCVAGQKSRKERGPKVLSACDVFWRIYYIMEPTTPLVAIVDDDESIRTALLRLFRFTHYRTEAFASCAEFLEFSAGNEPDCVVLDMRLPGMTGIELVRHLSSLEKPPPLIVITGDIEQRTKEECMALGTRYFFNKPFDGRTLVDSVVSVVGTGSRPVTARPRRGR